MQRWTTILSMVVMTAGSALAQAPATATPPPAATTETPPATTETPPTTTETPPATTETPPTTTETPPATTETPATPEPPPPPPLPPPPAKTPAADPASADAVTGDAAVSAEVPAGRRLGDPEPLTRREPTLKANTLMVGARYGLVGNGPTRFVDDVRYAITDTIELRTALLPWPTSLMGRVRLGSVNDSLGAFVLDAGLSYFDAGVRLVPDTGEANVGVRLHFEGVVAWQKAIADRVALSASGHFRTRNSFLADDDQYAAAASARVTTDVLDNLAVAAGLGFASTLGTPVREVVVNFTETDGAGISHLLARNEDGIEQSLTIPLTLTYGRVDSFDVDLFCTPQVYPEFGVLFGAGVRLRIDDLF
jgi:hypothetical protein